MSSRLLFVSPNRPDAGAIEKMLGPVGVPVDHVRSVATARERLASQSYEVVLTEAELGDGGWTDVLNFAHGLPHAPVVLVTHRLADNNLWAEVLNLGAYDLLAQPFDRGEVQRIVTSACRHAAPRKPVASKTMHAGRPFVHNAAF